MLSRNAEGRISWKVLACKKAFRFAYGNRLAVVQVSKRPPLDWVLRCLEHGSG